jgi:hypothetical protein
MREHRDVKTPVGDTCGWLDDPSGDSLEKANCLVRTPGSWTPLVVEHAWKRNLKSPIEIWRLHHASWMASAWAMPLW